MRREPDGVRRRGRPSTGVREAILRAATEILAERGGVGVATKAIAQRAQVAESSIFYHFKDRLGLLQAIVSESVPAYLGVVDAATEGVSRHTPAEGIGRILAALETLYAQVIPVQAAVLSDPELRDAFSQRAADLDVGPHRALPPIIGYLEAEVRTGRVRAEVDLAAVALMIVGTSHQRALHRHLSAAPDRLPTVGAIAESLARGIGSAQ